MTRRAATLLLAATVALAAESVPKFEQLRTALPQPILDSKPNWIAAYWKAWEFASRNFHEPSSGSGFPSRFIDAAFSDNIYFWDTAFMTMFCNIAGKLVPGIESLDNFYAKQHPDGEIAREIVRATGEDYFKWVNTERRPFFSRWGWDGFGPKMKVLGPDDPVQYVGRKAPARLPDLTLDNLNHPIAAWAEVESYRYTGDRERLARVFAPLAKYYDFLREHLRQGNGLYLTDWASMDDSPRNIYLKGGGTGVDISSEMVLFANHMAEMALVLNRPALAKKYRADAADVAARINHLMWNPEKRFYVDLKLQGEQAPVKTIAGFWPLLARVASKDRAKALVDHLNNPKTFGSPHRVPTCAADEPSYRAGVYWQGAVWAPTNTMVLRGLEAFGEHALARKIALEHIEAVGATLEETGTIWENYSPDRPAPGRPARKNFVGWSGIGPILYLLEYGIGLKPDAPRNRLEWRIADVSRMGCLRYRFNGHIVDLVAEAGVVRVESDGPFELKVNAITVQIKTGKQEFPLVR